jgi:hypothetical protein
MNTQAPNVSGSDRPDPSSTDADALSEGYVSPVITVLGDWQVVTLDQSLPLSP